MRLHDLYSNFMDMSEDEQIQFFHSYYEERTRILDESVIVKVKATKAETSRKQDKKITVTHEQLVLLKRLGLV